MKNEIELYVNKKFDIPQIIKMVLKRKNWGETYTLYKTKNFEIMATMESFNFKKSYAIFNIKANENDTCDYCCDDLYVYTNRDDYTIEFINRLLLKRIREVIISLVKNKFENEFRNIMPYPYMSEKSNEEWAKILNIEEEVEKIKNLDIDSDMIESCIENLINEKHYDYVRDNYFTPRNNYINSKIKNDFPNELNGILEEIENDILKIDKGDK